MKRLSWLLIIFAVGLITGIFWAARFNVQHNADLMHFPIPVIYSLTLIGFVGYSYISGLDSLKSFSKLAQFFIRFPTLIFSYFLLMRFNSISALGIYVLLATYAVAVAIWLTRKESKPSHL